MRTLFLLFTFFFSLFSFHTSLYAQVADFFRYQQATKQEKLFLTTDRPYYQAGDTLWFRGTLATADRLSYVVKSNYVTVELLNSSDRLVMRRKVRREGLCFDHCLPLSSELRSGEYTLRGYTTWMQNFSPDLFFSQKLTIVNPSEPPVAVPTVNPDFGIQFFPEGGTLLTGQLQTIAFKAEGNNGFPVAVKGVVKDASGNEVVAFRSSHDGMGTFRLTGQSHLTAEVTAMESDDSSEPLLDTLYRPLTHALALPSPQQGYAIALTRQDEESIDYEILSSSVSDSPTDSLTLLLHAGGRVVSVQQVAARGKGTLSIRSAREGINHLLLLDAAGQPLSRRLLFHRVQGKVPEGDVRVQWNPSEAKGYVAVKVHLQDKNGSPLRGDFAISVTDAGYVNPQYEPYRDQIESHLLLTSDLRGYIHDPAWYFERPQAPIDLLMLTHGWCRFRTDSLVYDPDYVFPFPMEEKEYVTGQVTHLPKNLKNPMISIVDTVGGTFGSARLGDDNRFFVGGLDFPDQALLNLRLTGKRSINPEFAFDPESFPAPAHKEPFRVDFDKYVATQAEGELFVGRDGMRTVMLDDIVVTDRRKSKSPYFKGISTERFREAEYLADNYDLYEYNDALQLVNQIIESEWSMRMTPLDESSGDAPSKFSSPLSWGEWGTFVINDEHYDNVYSAIGVLRRIKSKDVARVEVIDQMQNMIEPFSGKVVLIVLLKDGAVIQSGQLDGRFASFRRFGYTPAQTFYNPIYATPEQKFAPLFPDLRKTLRWIPSLQSDEHGDLQFDFFNSDHVGPRLVTLSGLTFDGRPVHISTMVGDR